MQRLTDRDHLKSTHAIGVLGAMRSGIQVVAWMLCVWLAICFQNNGLCQGIDENWTISVSGQTVQFGPDGRFRIPNVPAPDQFGLGGPGTAPDFISDDFVRAVAVTNNDGVTRYAFSEPFQFRDRRTFFVGEMTVTETAPPFPESIRIETISTLVPVGETEQLSVIGTLLDGTEIDVTSRTSWTIYRTSSPQIASIGPDGLLMGRSVGPVVITAVNEGATAVKFFQVTSAIGTTTLEGFVQLRGGTPVEGASVLASFQQSAVTDQEGFFSLEVEIPEEAEKVVSARVSVTVGGIRFAGETGSLPAVLGGITDAGIVTLEEDVRRGVIVLEGGDAGPFHRATNYLTELLRGARGDSPLPALAVTNFGVGVFAFVGVPTTVVNSLAGVDLNDFSVLYIASPSTCCDDGRRLVTGFEPVIAEYVAGGGSLIIQDYQAAGWETVLGFSTPVSAVRGYSGGAGGPVTPGSSCFDGNRVTALGLEFGITAAPNLGCFGHQTYDTTFFGPLGFVSLIDPPNGVFPAGFATVIAFIPP